MKPNILLITSDQQHWNTLSAINSEVQTPNLDRLASQGTRFDRAYCPNPTCSPTRSSIITGLYPSQHGCWALGTKLSEDVHTVGEDFNDAGYKTALIGKAHFQPLRSTEEYPSLESYPIMQDLDFWRSFDGPFYGFQRVELARNHADEAHVGQHYAIWMEEKGCTNWRDYYKPPTGNNDRQKHTWEIPEEYHYGTWIAERSMAHLEEYHANDEPFFLWTSFFDPHPPYLAPEPWDNMYDPDALTIETVTEGEHDNNPPHFQETQKLEADFSPWQEEEGKGAHGFHSHVHTQEDLAKDVAIYYGMISLMDKQIGQILDKLDELGLAENTLVIFTSDHGHFYGHHGLIAKGAFHYEDMIRVPFIARYPEHVPAGATSNSLLSLVDLAPTFLSASGLDIPRAMTGKDQTPALFDPETSVRDHVIVENHHQPTVLHVKTYVDERYKITVYYDRPYGELFDLETDPGEVNNLWNAPDSAALKAKMTMKLLHAEMGKESMWMPRVWGA
ncbi:MAG: sulfatase-like hydrolase/transferase [Chloroflexota bacterium]